MTVPRSERPTVEQMRHLIDHTDQRALSFAEAARLRAGFEHLVASQASQASQHASVDDLNHAARRRYPPGPRLRLRHLPGRRRLPLHPPLRPAHARLPLPTPDRGRRRRRAEPRMTTDLDGAYRERAHLLAWLAALHPGLPV